MHRMLDLPADGGLGLRRCQWRTTTLNKKSEAAALRLGFKEEGVLRAQWVLPEGKEGVRRESSSFTLVALFVISATICALRDLARGRVVEGGVNACDRGAPAGAGHLGRRCAQPSQHCQSRGGNTARGRPRQGWSTTYEAHRATGLLFFTLEPIQPRHTCQVPQSPVRITY